MSNPSSRHSFKEFRGSDSLEKTRSEVLAFEKEIAELLALRVKVAEAERQLPLKFASISSLRKECYAI